MANLFVRSRPTATYATGAKSLGDKVVSTSSTTGLGVLFEVTTAGTSSGAEPAWNLTVGGTTTDGGGVVWTTRGGAGIWLASKTWALGDRVVKVSQIAWNSASSVVWECTTAGAGGGTEPTWPTTVTAGTTTQTDGSATWTARKASTWDNAHPFLGALLKDASNATIKVAVGDTIYVSKTHNELNANASFNNTLYALPTAGTATTFLLCVDDTGQLTSGLTLATGAVISVGGSFNNLQMSGTCIYAYGIQFINACTSSGEIQIPAVGQGAFWFDTCPMKLSNSGNAGSRIEWGSNGSGPSVSKLILNNVTVSFAATSQFIRLQPGEIVWKNTPSALQGAAVPGTLFDLNNGVNAGLVKIEGVDLSTLGANGFFSTLGGVASTRIQFKNCKISASSTFGTTSSLEFNGPTIDWINCSASGTNYTLHSSRPNGTLDHELTKVMTGGATDGTTPISWKMVTNANVQYPFALETLEFVAWNDNSGGSKTATVEFLLDSLTALNNDDIWMELQYLSDSGDPMAGFANDTKSNVLASNAAQPTSTQAWTTTGITNVMKQKLQVSFTPQQKGPVRAVIKLSKPSTTVYVNPRMSIA